MANKQEQISKLITEAGELHHKVYRIVDGDDPDWASWYAEWLLDLSELPKILGKKPPRSHVVYALVQAEIDYAIDQPKESWQDFYAKRLLEL